MISETAFIAERVILGKNCRIYNYASIGNPAQWKGEHEEGENYVVIEDNVEIREFVTINAPTTRETFIGANCLLMANSHVGHDTQLFNDVVLGVGCALSGFVTIGEFSYLGLNSSVHQYCTFPAYSCLGANSFYKSNYAVQGLTWVGCPAKPVKVNLIGIERNIKDVKERERLIENASKFLDNYGD